MQARLIEHNLNHTDLKNAGMSLTTPVVELAIEGRYRLISSQEAYPETALNPKFIGLPVDGHFTTKAINQNGAEIILDSQHRPQKNDHIMLQSEPLGLINGQIKEVKNDSSFIIFNIGPKRRERIADYLTFAINKESLAQDERREAERIMPLNRLAILKTMSGIETMAKIENLSRTGAAISSGQDIILRNLQKGEKVKLGQYEGIVVRHIPGPAGTGAAIAFCEAIPALNFDEEIRL